MLRCPQCDYEMAEVMTRANPGTLIQLDQCGFYRKKFNSSAAVTATAYGSIAASSIATRIIKEVHAP